MAHGFAVQAKVASLGYHVYKVATLGYHVASLGNHVYLEKCNGKWKKSLLQLNRMKLQNKSTHIAMLLRSNLVQVLWQLVTYSDIFLDLVVFFFKEEQGEINGKVFGTTYRPSPIQSDGLEIPLLFQFQSPKYLTHCKMKRFLQVYWHKSWF